MLTAASLYQRLLAGTLFAFILVCIGIIILRFRDPGRARPFRVPLGPVLVPALGIVSCLGLIVYLPPTSWWRFVAWLLVGLVVYVLYGYRHSRLRHARSAGA
jgi:APA family basic amino acid/polyamine antiporter